MRILFLFLSVMLVAVSAEANQYNSDWLNLCRSDWLRGATVSSVRALIAAGADVNQVCNTNRNRPLHQALLNDRVDPALIRALLEAGADPYADNIQRQNAMEYADERFERARNTFRPGTAPYERERALYVLMFDDPGDTRQVVNPLCDPEWWGSSANGSSVRSLLASPSVDPEVRCNENSDRPLHLALRWETFPFLPAGVRDAVLALATSGVSLGTRNNRGRTALDLVEMRYERYLVRVERSRPAWCQGGAADPDIGLYLGVKFLATGESRESLLVASRERLLAATRRDVCGGAGGDVPRQVGSVFQECDACPEMVVMPGGRLALGRFEVTVGEYGAFASAGGGAGGGCYAYQRVDANKIGRRVDGSASWRNPGFSQSNRHPVVCVSWQDAQQYVSWLSQTTGATYRLPSEGEWGRAAGGSGGGCSVNGADRSFEQWLQSRFSVDWDLSSSLACQGSDGSATTAAVGTDGSNGVGLSDMVGNVWEWTEDCWEGDCTRRVVRGGSWSDLAEDLRPGARTWDRAGNRDSRSGFRVARTLD